MAALLSLDYFFMEPLFSFRVDASANCVALGAFGLVGLLVGFLSARAGQRERIAVDKRYHIAKLYELGRFALLLDLCHPPGPRIAGLVQRAIGLESVALFDPSSGRIDEAGVASPEISELARNVWTRHSDSAGYREQAWAGVLQVGGRIMGGIAMRGKDLNPLVVNETASIAAIALERSRIFRNAAHADAEHQCDRLRTALLNAFADTFETPLSTMRAASSGLREAGALRPAHVELVELIEGETARLGSLAARLLQAARLDRFDPPVRREECRISRVIDELRERVPAGVRVVDSTAGFPAWTRVWGSRELLVAGLFQLVDNALKYSTPGSPITVGIRPMPGEVVISVHNYGPPIRPEDQHYIFERFYRAPGTKHLAPGAGLGLSIARKIAEGHGGRIWVFSNEGHGTTFFFALPAGSGNAGPKARCHTWPDTII